MTAPGPVDGLRMGNGSMYGWVMAPGAGDGSGNGQVMGPGSADSQQTIDGSVMVKLYLFGHY